MAFGLLTIKWHCLRKMLETLLENSTKCLEVCAWMHNNVLDCKIQKEEGVEVMEGQDTHGKIDVAKPDIHVMPPLRWGYLPTVDDLHSLSCPRVCGCQTVFVISWLCGSACS
jgi:hypothetical protein